MFYENLNSNLSTFVLKREGCSHGSEKSALLGTAADINHTNTVGTFITEWYEVLIAR